MIVWGWGWLSKSTALKNGVNGWKRFWHNVWYIVSFRWLWGKKNKKK